MSKAALKAIRAHCDECCGDMPARDCNCTWCKLWEYRLGSDPAIAKKQFTDEQRAQMSERLKSFRNK